MKTIDHVTKMEKEAAKNDAGKSTDKTQNGLPSIVIDNAGQNHEVADSHKNNKDNPANYSSHKSDRAVGGNIKAFMGRDAAAEWVMVALTLAIVISTIITTCFTCRQISIYENVTRVDLRPYIVFDEDPMIQQGFNVGKEINLIWYAFRFYADRDFWATIPELTGEN